VHIPKVCKGNVHISKVCKGLNNIQKLLMKTLLQDNLNLFVPFMELW